jgi:hypothetical protein
MVLRIFLPFAREMTSQKPVRELLNNLASLRVTSANKS